MTSKNKKAHRTRSQAKREETVESKSVGLYKAVALRNVEKTKKWLKAGALADFIVPDNNMSYTAFHAALPEYNNSKKDDEQESALHITLLNVLVDQQYSTRDVATINIFSEDSNGMNPFEWALADGHQMCVQWFLEQLTLMHDPAFSDEIINRVNDLETTLPSRDVKRTRNQIPIHVAIRSESIATVKHLCRFEPKPDILWYDDAALNAIHIAVKQNVPAILRYILKLAEVDDIEHLKYNGMTALQHAQHIYHHNLTHAVLPRAISKSWQCVQLVKDKLKGIPKLVVPLILDPSFNAVLQFWPPDAKNPNTNIHHTRIPRASVDDSHPIHQDARSIIEKQTPSAKYVAVTFAEAARKQHQSASFAATHRGVLNASERYVKRQKLSAFTKQFKQALRRGKQLIEQSHDSDASSHDIDASSHCTVNIDLSSDSVSIAETTPTPSEFWADDATDESNHNRKKPQQQRISSPTFSYDNQETVTVVAINPHLERELTSEDRVRLYEMSIGVNSGNPKLQIMEIFDAAHPAKRHSLDTPVFGLFATSAIKKKEFILEYSGLLQSANEYDAELNEFERFDAQHRVHELETYAENSKMNRLYVNASYFSNECVFVNDATFDDVYGRWSKRNVSFFEIVINGWPHMFLRCFVDIEVGDELLTYYGKKFWDQYTKDCKISRNLYAYHLYRSERENAADSNANMRNGNASVNVSRKRQRMIDDNNDAADGDDAGIEVMSHSRHKNKKRKTVQTPNRLSVEEQDEFQHPSAGLSAQIDKQMLRLMESNGSDDSTWMQLLRLQIQKNQMLSQLLTQTQMNEQRLIEAYELTLHEQHTISRNLKEKLKAKCRRKSR